MATQLAISGMEELAKREEMEVSPLSILQSAVDKGASAETLEKLVALQLKIMAVTAEQSYRSAMNAAQSEMAPVVADSDNSQTNSKYASYKALDKAVRPIYVKNGFSLEFNTAPCEKPETVRVLCAVSHVGGHSEHKQIDMPADGKGAKGGDVMTKTHATGAATQYGMRYLLKMIFNLAIDHDTDGNTGMSDLQEQLEWIANAKDLDELKKLWTNAKKSALEAKDHAGLEAINKAKEARKRELNG